MFTVATYNMRKAIGTDRRRRPDRILEVLHEIDADIVALQEADRRFGSRQSAIPVPMIEHSAYKPVDYDIRPGGIGWHGNAILVRKSAEILDLRPLDLPTLEPRGAVMADIRLKSGLTLRIVGMHLDLSGLMRRRQARAVIAQVQARPTRLPTILMGDLNEWMRHGGCLREFMTHYHIAPSGPSYHSQRPIGRLDRIMASADLHVVASGTHHSIKAREASDHLPVWARLQGR